MKEIIKKLSAEQVQLKIARKTGSNPEPQAILKSNQVAAQIRRNAARITAALNIYHEIRGSSYRHNHKSDYWYKKDLEYFKEILTR